MGRPIGMTWDVGRRVWKAYRALKRGTRLPIVLMLEPLEACNLRCAGCGRIREYADRMNARMSADEAARAARRSGAPIVSVSGGEPLLHEDLRSILLALLEEDRWVFLCTNGLLLEEHVDRLPRDRRLCLVVHLDGTPLVHDQITGRPGSFEATMRGLRRAISAGFRVCTNTTVFHGSDIDDVRSLFGQLADQGIEGLMLSPGYAYESVSQRDLFLQREESIRVFRQLLSRRDGLPFYDNPLFLDFLEGRRDYACSAWAIPTYTVSGWRLPCYLIADRHTPDLEEVLAPSVWQAYGPGRDPRCGGCMLHSGFEPSSAMDAVAHPWKLLGTGRKP